MAISFISLRKDVKFSMRHVRDTSLGHHSDWCAVIYPTSDSTEEGAEARAAAPPYPLLPLSLVRPRGAST
ncbi:Uncharacterized protein HZ326_15498 [Fusarium oxysporum f. sp. albedinis]|nr:Uncharacterized protein HZ326_15498 [Fusarium oxysporum f. sp. albedinis]